MAVQQVHPPPQPKQSSFEMMKEDNCYLDKTKIVKRLLLPSKVGGKYFLSRPHRFGKSLLISQLECFFRGNRKAFEGLAIDNDPDLEWKQYPVIRIDFSILECDTADNLKLSLIEQLKRIAKKEAPEVVLESTFLSGVTQEVVKGLAASSPHGRVVVLVDEYEYPVTYHLAKKNLNVALLARDVLSSFYKVLKGVGEHIQFMFATGITRFARVSVFSGADFKDITYDPIFSSVVGFTWDEIKATYSADLATLADKTGLDESSLKAKIFKMYNGYNFGGNERILNPISINGLLASQTFSRFWKKETAQPFWLRYWLPSADKLSSMERVPIDLTRCVELEDFEGKTLFSECLALVLLQIGYLTINVTIDEENDIVQLCCPNGEAHPLLHELFEDKIRGELESPRLRALSDAIQRDDVKSFVNSMDEMFHSIPYDSTKHVLASDYEGYYQSHVFHLLWLLSFLKFGCEPQVSEGRLDFYFEGTNEQHILEMKICKSTNQSTINQKLQSALKQIKEKGYGSFPPYFVDKPKYAYGVVFVVDSKHKFVESQVSPRELIS